MRAKLAATAVTAAAVVLGAAAAATPGAARSSIRPAVAQPQARLLSTAVFSRPPTTAQCEAAVHVACYAPFQFHRAYNTTPLYDAGLTGRGRTIVIVDSFGSPTIRRDLATFDRAFGLPAPPKLTILQPAGQVPPFDPNDATMVGWAEETTPDVEWSHAMAPGANVLLVETPVANVLLVETPVAETEGTVGFPQIVQAENYVISHRLGDVISQSFGATEETFPSRQSLLDLRSAFRNAATHGVTVLGASGDAGPTDPRFNGTLFTHRVNFWPSSDPLVTSVGGTQLHLDARGDRTRPDNVWNDTQLLHAAVAGGGGLSHIFARPGYQDSVRNVVDGAARRMSAYRPRWTAVRSC